MAFPEYNDKRTEDYAINSGFVKLNDTSVIDPSVMEWDLSDVSASDAGRDEKAEMHPMKISQKRQYTLEWNMIDPYNAQIILAAINSSETFNCTLWDALDGQLETRTYYVSDRSAPVQQWFDRKDGQLYEKISFQLIEV